MAGPSGTKPPLLFVTSSPMPTNVSVNIGAAGEVRRKGFFDEEEKELLLARSWPKVWRRDVATVGGVVRPADV